MGSRYFQTFGVRALLAISLATSLWGCGTAFDKLTGRTSSKTLAEDDSEKVSVSMSVRPKVARTSLTDTFGLTAFGLQSVSGFIMDVTNCASGYSISDVTEAAASSKTVKLYKTDRGCTAELQQFTYNGKDFTQQGGGNLSSGSSTFEDTSDPTNTLHVSLIAQLPSPLTDGATATFAFHEIKEGTAHAISNYSHSETLEVVGVGAPNYSISDVQLISIAANGTATFDIVTECGRTVIDNAGAKSCEVTAGDEQPFVDTKLKLIQNDAGTYTGGVITYAQAVAAMAAGTTTLADTDYDSTTANHGFSIQLDGPGQLYSNKDMFLIIEYTDATYGSSFRYFNVTIGDPQ